METEYQPVYERMKFQVEQWEQASDRRAIFLGCYSMMTANMLAAIEARKFFDPAWVRCLLINFAGYYFGALQAFEQSTTFTPAAWLLAFEAARKPETLALQNLLLGVNAHINYDLVLAVAEMLEPEWAALSPAGRQERHSDYCTVNDIIAQTIDSVQDAILERYSPRMNLIDVGLGRLDEWIVVSMIKRWRDQVWEQAVLRLECPPGEREEHRLQIEKAAIERGRLILMNFSSTGVDGTW